MNQSEKIKKRDATNKPASIFINDLLSNIEMIAEGKFSKKSSCSVIALNSNDIDEEEVDRRLVNWKKWIEIREKESQRIAKATLRNRQELLLNLNPNDYRKIVKQREIIEKSRDNAGDLKFWKMPEKIGFDLFVTLPKSEIVYTQTPDALLNEQKISKKERPITQKLLEKMNEQHRIVEYIPHMEELALVGNLKAKPKFSAKKPRSEILLLPKEKERKQILVVDEISVNGQSDISIDLTFSSFKYEEHTRYLKFENCGEVAIDIYFSKFVSTDTDTEKVFFFNECPFRIIPDQIKQLKIKFDPKNFGKFTEKWFIKCQSIHDYSFQIKLMGVCDKKHKNERNTKQEIESIVRQIITTAAPICREQKRELFVDAQKVKFLNVNPHLEYNWEAVDIMTRIHKELTKESETEWNLNVSDLYRMIINIHDNDEWQRQVYNKFNHALKTLMESNKQTNDEVDESMIKFCMIRNNFAIFLERLATEMEEVNDSSKRINSIKSHFCKVLAKMIDLLES
ncbi:hypothetical protein PVAND_010742 [Polypedilum vanderplanki]|uniref:Uncharacterized protein n=1 Tax=Polypedilum vanderplanki TaxID=319348 RepID=A0A9J6CHR5_POLVA|nr:hypothetical protein PVAND_010742 [Polypedilum vanderplanki]